MPFKLNPFLGKLDYYEKGGLVGTKEVDETNIANNRILVYNSSTGKLEYQNKPTGGAEESLHPFLLMGG